MAWCRFRRGVASANFTNLVRQWMLGHHGWLFANAQAMRVKLLVPDGFGVRCANAAPQWRLCCVHPPEGPVGAGT